MAHVPDAVLSRAALLLSGASAAAVLFSIAVSQILLAAALLTLLLARERARMPPLVLPLLLFFAGTLLSLAFSPEPAAGLPQVRKFFVYSVLLVICTTFRGTRDVLRLIGAWAVLASASGIWSFVQLWHKRTEAAAEGSEFYLYYVANRVTGFMSHWMTFSGEQMIAGLVIAALAIFGVMRRWYWTAATVVIGASILVAWTRSVWLGCIGGAVYLIAVWRPKLLLAAPVVLAAGFFAAPEAIQRRAVSIYRPQAATDSNEHRRITFITGMEMIRRNPLLGVGPERVGREFLNYLPPDIPRPLPAGYYDHLHSIYLHYAAERGIPAMLALLWLVLKALVDFARAVRRLAPEEQLRRAILHGAIACIIGVLIEGFFEYNLNDTEVLTMFLALVASGYVTAREPRHA